MSPNLTISSPRPLPRRPPPCLLITPPTPLSFLSPNPPSPRLSRRSVLRSPPPPPSCPASPPPPVPVAPLSPAQLLLDSVEAYVRPPLPSSPPALPAPVPPSSPSFEFVQASRRKKEALLPFGGLVRLDTLPEEEEEGQKEGGEIQRAEKREEERAEGGEKDEETVIKVREVEFELVLTPTLSPAVDAETRSKHRQRGTQEFEGKKERGWKTKREAQRVKEWTAVDETIGRAMEGWGF